MAEKKVIHILNLAGELNSFLQNFFVADRFKLQQRDEVQDITQLDYILVASVEEANIHAKEYNVVKNDIEIICLERGVELKDFLLANGRFLLNSEFQAAQLGTYLFNKFFEKKTSLHLEENFGENLTQYESFTVTNHLNMGLSLDEMSSKLFKQGFNIVSLRSFVDHVVYYMVYLKQAGLAGIPFEVEYGYNDDFMVLSLNCSVKNFVAEYLIDAFGEINATEPLNYLLRVAAKACDFLDVSYVDNPNRLLLTGYFFKNNENRLQGLSFNNIQTLEQVEQTLENRIKNFIPTQEDIEQLQKEQKELADKNLPGGIIDLVQDPPKDSVLNENKQEMQEMVEFMADQFAENNPGKDLKDFSVEDFAEILPGFESSEFVEQLSPEDKDFLVERVKNNNVVKAYNEDLAKARSEIFDDAAAKQQLTEVMGNEVAERVASHVDASLLNNILAKDTNPPSKAQQSKEGQDSSIFGTFESNIPDFSVDDAFDSIAPDFAEPQDFDNDLAFESFANDFPDTIANLEDAPINFDNIDAEVDLPSFEVDNFDDILPTNSADFPIQDYDIAKQKLPDAPAMADDPLANIVDLPLKFDDSFDIAALEELTDEGQTINGLPGDLDGTNNISGGKEEGDVNSLVKGSKDEGDFNSLVKGGKPEADSNSLVKGAKEKADDFVKKIAGLQQKDDDFVATFSNAFDDKAKEGLFSFSSSSTPEERTKDIHTFVNSTMESSSMFMNLGENVKEFVNEEAPMKISAGLEDFAADLGKTLDNFAPEDFQRFKDEKLPDIVSNLILDDDKIEQFKNKLYADSFHSGTENYDEPFDLSNSFESKFKACLETKLQNMQNVEQQDGKYVITENSMGEDDMQMLIRDTMRETFEEEFKFSNASPEEIQAKETQLISELSQTLQMPEEDIAKIVKGASDVAKEKEKQLVTEKMFAAQKLQDENDTTVDSDEDQAQRQQVSNTKAEAELIKRLKIMEIENQQLKTNISAMELKIGATDEVKQKFDKILEEVDKETSEASISENSQEVITVTSAEDKKKILNQVTAGKPIDKETVQQLTQSFEKEAELAEIAKEKDAQLKKAQMEADKKDALFKLELERAQKALKTKDVVLDKAKESMKTMMTKKEKELSALKSQVSFLNQKLKSNESDKLQLQVKSLTKTKESLERSAELYKTKLENVTKNIEDKKKHDNTAMVAEENRNLMRLKTQLENKLNGETKTKRSLEERYQKAKSEETRVKNEMAKAQVELKTAQSQLKMLKEQNAKLVQTASSAGKVHLDKAVKELEHEKSKSQKLLAKIETLNKRLAEAASSNPLSSHGTETTVSSTNGHVDSSQLKTELEKNKKEVDHLKDLNQKLQNKIEELSKKHKDTPVVNVADSALAEMAASKQPEDNTKSLKEIEKLKGDNSQLQDRITELTEKLEKAQEKANAPATPVVSANEDRLAQSVRKMNSELTKAKTETAEMKKENMKFKKDITGFKNKIKMLEKELERAKKGGPAKKKRAA